MDLREMCWVDKCCEGFSTTPLPFRRFEWRRRRTIRFVIIGLHNLPLLNVSLGSLFVVSRPCTYLLLLVITLLFFSTGGV